MSKLKIFSRTKKIFRGSAINLLYLPVVLLFLVFVIYPVIRGFAISATNWDGYSPTSSYVGFENYSRLLSDINFRIAIKNTAIYGFGSTFIQQVLGLVLAMLLDIKLRGRNLARSIIYLPVLVSPVVMGTMYYLVFRYNQGAINDFIAIFGMSKISWFSDSHFAIVIILLVNSLQFVGISMVIYLSGLQSIPEDIKEAASLDGVVGLSYFWKITVPLLLPAFAASVIINLIGGLKLFDIIQVLTGGGPGYSTHSVSTLIGKTYFGSQSAGYAAAQGVVLFILIAIISILLNLWFDRRRVRLEN